MHHYSVILPTIINEPLTYKSNKDIEVGAYVVVSLRKKLVVGIVLEKKTRDEELKFEVKEIDHILPLPLVSEDFINTFKDIAHFHMEPLGMIFSLTINIVDNFWKQILTIEKIIGILKKGGINAELSKDSSDVSRIDINRFLYKKDSYQCHITPNELQINALTECENFFISKECEDNKTKEYDNNKKIVLLEGETGSGKTIVFFERIKHILENDPSAQILILLPEIALTNAILSRVEDYFGFKPFPWHSNLSAKERKENFLAITFNLARIIVGARSAIFLPFQNLKLIVIDEEHDYSFKQEQQIFYHTVDVAKIMMAHNNDLQIILSSATPSLESIFNVKRKDYLRVLLKSEKQLSERFSISIENMNSNENRGKIISQPVIETIKHYLENGLQSMIFLNRRGYNSLIICKKCNGKLLCKNCSVGMVYFKDEGKFFCPQCNYGSLFNQTKCSTCFSDGDFKFYGYGVEKIFEIMSEHFPELANRNRIAILSSDNSKDLQETIKRIENGDVDLIVGTQILAKGHNFPKLGFLTVLDGGLNFSGVDLRSAEKTYQILHQIVGRLGRFGVKGEVIIQTYEPQSLILKALSDYNRAQFYTYEFKQRKEFEMPPFFQLFKITFADISQEKAMKAALKFVSELDYDMAIEILGPAPSAIIRLNRMYRYNVMLKTHIEFNLQKFLYRQLQKESLKGLRMRIDINPMNFV